eukprot:scaffold408_cov388-Prasinococcus_capsulatus_cf.AAC.9
MADGSVAGEQKREKGAALVQTVGVVSTAILLTQVYIAGHMPGLCFWPGLAVVIYGLSLNFLNFVGKAWPVAWQVWEKSISIIGLTVLPQVIWSTFSSVPTLIPGLTACAASLGFAVSERSGRLPKRLSGVWNSVGAWTATLLFMFMPVAQLWQNFTRPETLHGISIETILLAMCGNALMIPRALFTRDIIWFIGTTWGSMLQGWGIFFTMYL